MRRQQGFSLIEILISIGLFGIVIGVILGFVSMLQNGIQQDYQMQDYKYKFHHGLNQLDRQLREGHELIEFQSFSEPEGVLRFFDKQGEINTWEWKDSLMNVNRSNAFRGLSLSHFHIECMSFCEFGQTKNILWRLNIGYQDKKFEQFVFWRP